MAYSKTKSQQDFCFTVHLDFPDGFDEQRVPADAKQRWLVESIPENGYCEKGITISYTGWREPKQKYLFNNQDRLTFVHRNIEENCIMLWGTRTSTVSLQAENILSLGSNFRLELEKALIFYATRIYHGQFVIKQIGFKTPINHSLNTGFTQQEVIGADQLNQPLANRKCQLALASHVPDARDLFSTADRFQQPLMVALKNYISAGSDDNRHRFDSSWRCLNTIYSTLFQRPMTAENKGDNDAQTLQYMAEKLFSQSAEFKAANEAATNFVLKLAPRRIIKLVNDAAKAEARYVDQHTERFEFPEVEKFNYTWQQLNFIVPFYQMLNDQHDIDDQYLALFMHFGKLCFHQNRDGKIITYPRAAELNQEHVKTIEERASHWDNEEELKMYRRYGSAVHGLLNTVNAYHSHLKAGDGDKDTQLPEPDLAMTLRIFFNYVRVLRNNYFHGGYSSEDFLLKDTNNQQEIAAIADILTRYNRTLLNNYSGELSQSQRDRSADALTW